MTASPAIAPPRFPPPEELAEAFYREAVRHLSDAYCLHRGSAWAGSIASAMKAGELGAKAVLILQNAMGIYEKVFNTHRPYTEMESHPILKTLSQELGSRLSLEVRELEALEPNLFGRRNFETAEANTEYPFLVKANGTPEQAAVAIVSPARFFDQAASERYCRTAHDLLTALPALYSDVAD